MKKKIHTEKIYNIDDYSDGDWICFLLPTNKKCVGIIVEMLIPDKTNDSYFQSIKTVNYIDEDGLHGSIRIADIKTNQRIIGVNMLNFFEQKFSPKTEATNKTFVSRKIAREYVRKANTKKHRNINNN